MISALLLAAAAASAPANGPDVYIGEDGCRYVRKHRPAPTASVVKPRPFVVQFAKPASAPASAPKKAKRKVLKREDVPAGFDRLCDESPPWTALETIIPPEAPPPLTVVDVPASPNLATYAGPELPDTLLLRDLPPAESVAGEAGPPFAPAWPPVIIAGPILAYLPPVTSPAPEPVEWSLVLAGLLALALRQRLRR